MDEVVRTPSAEAAEPAADETGAGDTEALKNAVIAAISECYDPEIPVNIYELGLIYDVAVGEGGKVDVIMTLTSPHCPVAEILPEQVKQRIATVDGVDDVDLEITWDPPWTPEMMSDAAKLELGFF